MKGWDHPLVSEEKLLGSKWRAPCLQLPRQQVLWLVPHAPTFKLTSALVRGYQRWLCITKLQRKTQCLSIAAISLLLSDCDCPLHPPEHLAFLGRLTGYLVLSAGHGMSGLLPLIWGCGLGCCCFAGHLVNGVMEHTTPKAQDHPPSLPCFGEHLSYLSWSKRRIKQTQEWPFWSLLIISYYLNFWEGEENIHLSYKTSQERPTSPSCNFVAF